MPREVDAGRKGALVLPAMAGRTERQAVVYDQPQVGMLGELLNVVSVEAAALPPAASTGVVVSFQDGQAPSAVGGSAALKATAVDPRVAGAGPRAEQGRASVPKLLAADRTGADGARLRVVAVEVAPRSAVLVDGWHQFPAAARASRRELGRLGCRSTGRLTSQGDTATIAEAAPLGAFRGEGPVAPFADRAGHSPYFTTCRRYQEHTGALPILEATGEPHDFTAVTHAD